MLIDAVQPAAQPVFCEPYRRSTKPKAGFGFGLLRPMTAIFWFVRDESICCCCSCLWFLRPVRFLLFRRVTTTRIAASRFCHCTICSILEETWGERQKDVADEFDLSRFPFLLVRISCVFFLFFFRRLRSFHPVPSSPLHFSLDGGGGEGGGFTIHLREEEDWGEEVSSG